MNKLILPFIITITLFLMTGCSEKFNVAAPYKDITVIYAFLDRADTAHYVRIQKAFLDQSKSALTMSQSPDSSFYKSLNVRINRISILDTNHVFDTIHLNRVDLNLEGYPKEQGIFFNSPNYAYKFTNILDPKYLYRIIVTNLITGVVDSSTSPIIDDVTPHVFGIDVLDDTGLNRAGMDFASTLPTRPFEMNVSYLTLANFYFEQLKSPVYLAEAIIRFNWVDSNSLTGSKTAHYYDFSLGDQTMPTTGGNAAVTYSTKPLNIYSALSSGLGVAPDNTYRLMDRCDLFAYVGTLDYYNYQQASLTQGLGLTGNEIEPVYTNVKGPNALGLYTSRGMHTGKINITFNTIDSLMVSPLMTNVRIRGTVYH